MAANALSSSQTFGFAFFLDRVRAADSRLTAKFMAAGSECKALVKRSYLTPMVYYPKSATLNAV